MVPSPARPVIVCLKEQRVVIHRVKPRPPCLPCILSHVHSLEHVPAPQYNTITIFQVIQTSKLQMKVRRYTVMHSMFILSSCL